MTDRDASMGPDGLTRRDRDLIRDVLARYPEVRRVTLFGSRAMGTFGRGSDIDLALEGRDLDARTLTRIATALEDSDLPYKVDLLLHDDQLEPKLEAHIRRDGKPFGWVETTLSDISTDIAYGYTQSADSEKVGPHFLRITDIQNGIVDWLTVPYCPISANDYAKYKLENGDIVVARTGNSTGENYMFRADEEAVFASYLIRFRIDPGQADPLFVWYWMRTPAWWSFVNNSKTGSAQAGANAKLLGSYQFTLPPIDEQCAIAGVLGSLDDKIEQNRRTARALERLARAIFRAWFVDFEPVKAKAVGAAAFPSMPQHVFDALPTTFTDSDLGPVPEGWEVKAIGDVCDVNARSIRKGEREGEIEYVNISSVTCGHLDEIERMDFADAPSRARRLIQDGDTIWSCVRPNRMSYLYIHDPPVNRIVSTGFAVLTPKAIGPSFLYQLTTQPAFVDYLVTNATGSAYPAVRGDHFDNAQFCCPPPEVLDAFDTMTQPIRRWIGEAERESRTLAELRDALLPKLLSGRVRVTQAEHVVAEVV